MYQVVSLGQQSTGPHITTQQYPSSWPGGPGASVKQTYWLAVTTANATYVLPTYN